MKPLLLASSLLLLFAAPSAHAWNLFHTLTPKETEAAGVTLKHTELRMKPRIRTYVRHHFDFTFDTATLPDKDYVDITVNIVRDGGGSEQYSSVLLFASNRDGKERYLHLSFEIEENCLAKSQIDIQRVLKSTKDTAASDGADMYEEGGYLIELRDFVDHAPAVKKTATPSSPSAHS